MNAAVWFGAAIFFTFSMGSAPFSHEMQTLLGEKNFPYYSGAIAQIFIARYFRLQLVCGAVAVLHLLGEWVYLGRTPQKMRVGLLAGLVIAALLGEYSLQPKLKQLHAIKYTAKAAQERETAASSFRAWHGFSQGINLLMMIGLGAYLWRLANPADPTRFVSAAKFRS